MKAWCYLSPDSAKFEIARNKSLSIVVTGISSVLFHESPELISKMSKAGEKHFLRD
jgi:hypothetical protein